MTNYNLRLDNVLLHNAKYEIKLFFQAFTVRVLCLLIIIFFANHLGADFNQKAPDPDDRRYEAGAEIFSNTAKNIMDIQTLTDAYVALDDYSGYYLQDFALLVSKGPLWYLIISWIYYIFKTRWAVRIFNIIISSISVIYLYRFCRLVGNEKMSGKAANLLSFLPYPVMFSCFAYKDCLVMFCFLYLLYNSTLVNRHRNILKRNWGFWIKNIFIAGLLLFLRSGFGALLCVFFVFNLFGIENLIHKRKVQRRFFKIIFPIIFMCTFAFWGYFSTLLYKLQYYINGRSTELASSTISFLTINGLTDLYKLPFTYVFSCVMPIGMFKGINSWYDIITNTNIIMVPIAVGATLYIFKKNKVGGIAYWGWLFFYCVSIVTSIGIFRHYYSLMPLSLIAYSDFTVGASRMQKVILLTGSMMMTIMLIVFYYV